MAITILIVCIREIPDFFSKFLSSLSLNTLSRLLFLGVPAAGHLVLDMSAVAFVTLLASRFEPNFASANQIALQILQFCSVIPLGLSTNASVTLAQKSSKSSAGAALADCFSIFFISLYVVVGIATCAFLFTNSIYSMFSASSKVSNIGIYLAPYIAGALVLESMQLISSGLTRGLENTRYSFLSILIGQCAFGVPLAFYLTLNSDLGLVGSWLGYLLGLFIANIILIVGWIRLSTNLSTFALTE
jgi:MATE family multidrug resistance protein